MPQDEKDPVLRKLEEIVKIQDAQNKYVNSQRWKTKLSYAIFFMGIGAFIASIDIVDVARKIDEATQVIEALARLKEAIMRFFSGAG